MKRQASLTLVLDETTGRAMRTVGSLLLYVDAVGLLFSVMAEL